MEKEEAEERRRALGGRGKTTVGRAGLGREAEPWQVTSSGNRGEIARVGCRLMRRGEDLVEVDK